MQVGQSLNGFLSLSLSLWKLSVGANGKEQIPVNVNSDLEE
jgi:hypothetical protein